MGDADDIRKLITSGTKKWTKQKKAEERNRGARRMRSFRMRLQKELSLKDAAAAVRERFASAAVAGTHLNRYGATDPYRLGRSPIQLSDGMRWFRRKVQGGMALEDDVRRVANRLRYAGATS